MTLIANNLYISTPVYAFYLTCLITETKLFCWKDMIKEYSLENKNDILENKFPDEVLETLLAKAEMSEALSASFTLSNFAIKHIILLNQNKYQDVMD